MILTITPNPTIDRVVFVRNFRLGAIVRGEREVATPSGKGVDGSLVIHELGGETVAAGLSAGHAGRLLTDMLAEMGVPHDFVPARGETRTALILVDMAMGKQSTILAPTLTATPEHLPHLIALLDRYAGRAWGVIFGGSLPPGFPPDGYVRLLRHARQRGMATLLDSSGESLRRGVAGRLGEWASDALIVTLGKRGALALTLEGWYHAQPPQVPVVNTAGAGDALNGGTMLARSRGADWCEALALGTAAAASVVMNDGTAICRREQVETLLSQVRCVGVMALDRS